VNRELVTAQVVDAKIEGRFELELPMVRRTPFKAIDEVDRDSVEPGLAQNLHSLTRVVGAVPATEKGKIVVVKRLDSETHEAHTEIAPDGQAFPADILGVRLEKEFCLTIHFEMTSETIENADQLFGG
jgi:hypothetical protein